MSAIDLRPPGQPAIALLMARRELAAKLLSPWLYAVASLLCLIAWVYGDGFLRSFETESVLVATDPLAALHAIVVIVLGVVLGLRLAAGLAWEREHRTLEVLLVGPVSHEAILISKFCVELCLFALLISVYLLYLGVAQPLGAGVIGLSDALAAGRLPLHALPVLALGLLVSAWARSVRGAVIVYLGIVIVLALFEIVLAALGGTPPENMTLTALYLHRMMEGVAVFLAPVSPVARLADLARGLEVQTPLAMSSTLMALLLTLALLTLAALVARARGAV